MGFDHYIRSGQRLLRCGYTTGTCAALAAQGAARLLLEGKIPQTLCLITPKGWRVEVVPQQCQRWEENAQCGVIKDAGDDRDVTDGMMVLASVCRISEPEITIEGGQGVGRVTKTGLNQPVGAAAINEVPRRMIRDAVRAVCERNRYTGGIAVTISIPGGEAAAQKTFNPKLGIQGGLSILGTSGIVEPMSEQAILDTIDLEIRQAATENHHLILTPGNYGADFLREHKMDQMGIPVVKCSNFVGEALDSAVSAGISQLLLVGHVGKLVKLAGGIMNTHSRNADCRTQLFCAYAAVCGADTALCRALLEAAIADACLELLDDTGLRDRVVEEILKSIQQYLQRRTGESCRVGAVIFSNQYGFLGQTDTAKEMLDQWNTKQEPCMG